MVFTESMHVDWQSSTAPVDIPEGKEDKVILNNTYVFKNLMIKETRAYYNENTLCLKSYDMAVGRKIIDRAANILLHPSMQVKAADAKSSQHMYLTIEGQVTSVSRVM